MPLLLAACALGFVLLARGADQMVEGSTRLAVSFRVSTVVVGVVVIGFGTSAPEMIVSGLAAGQGSPNIAVGNIIGSNVANLSLVLGCAVLITSLAVPEGVLRREAPVSTASVVLFAVLVQGGLQRWEGIVLAVGMGVAMALILKAARDGALTELEAELVEFTADGATHSTRIEVVRTLAGLAGTLLGAQLLVWGATGVADRAGVDEGFVGLTLVALGTSLPELVTAVQAARRHEHELIVGNLLGSNLFNSLAVGSIAAFAGPGPLTDSVLEGRAVVIMVAVAVGAWAAMRSTREMVRWEGAVLVGAYVVAVPLLAR